jgi:hypothetical protein
MKMHGEWVSCAWEPLRFLVLQLEGVEWSAYLSPSRNETAASV